MIQAVLFDMDGLLINSEPLWRKAEIAVFAEVGLALTEDDCKKMMGFRLNEVVAYWYLQQPWSTPSTEAIEALILTKVSQLIADEGTALPGVYHALALCRALSMKCAIASSSPMILIDAVVEKLQIKSYFSVRHSAQFERLGKPDPAVFLSAAKMLEVPASGCLVLEDSYHGMTAGLAASMRVVMVPAPDDYSDPRLNVAFDKLPSLSELRKKHFA